jgi:hypothetical protein
VGLGPPPPPTAWEGGLDGLSSKEVIKKIFRKTTA